MVLLRGGFAALSLLVAGCGSQEAGADALSGFGAGETPTARPSFDRIVPEPSTELAAIPCPFEASGWRARVTSRPGRAGGAVALTGEVRATGPAAPLVEPRPGAAPPEMVFDLKPGDFPASAGPVETEATAPGGSAFTHASIHCAGREIARVPIGREG
jgi:hypothetical protein